MLTRRERRRRAAFMRQFHSQVEQERNGAPVPPEIAARMTKPAQLQVPYQVVVDQRKDDGTSFSRPVFPAMVKEAAEQFVMAINSAVSLGNEKTWSNARAVPCQAIGVN